MNYKKYLLFSLLLCSSTAIASYSEVDAQEPANKVANAFDITFEPPKENQPRATRAGASRGNQCAVDSHNVTEPFIPLLPSNDYGLTVASHPTILAHVPDSSAEYIFFTLQDENNEEAYQTILPIGSEPGIISISIPSEAPGLETGKTYKWSFALMCDNKLRPDSPIVEGFVKRVNAEPYLAAKLENSKAETIQKAALYGKAGIWYETISTLAQLRQAQPQDPDLNLAWNNLLNDVGLENIANAEIVD